MNYILNGLLFCILIFSASCLSYTVKIDSQPQGASVAYNGINLGQTPCNHRITTGIRDRIDLLVISKEGYQTKLVELPYHHFYSDFNPIIWLPILITYGIPALWLFAPDPKIKIDLQAGETSDRENQVLHAIAAGKVFIGMTKEEILRSVGSPSIINQTITGGGTREQWIYGLYSTETKPTYLYLDNGILTGIQN